MHSYNHQITASNIFFVVAFFILGLFIYFTYNKFGSITSNINDARQLPQDAISEITSETVEMLEPVSETEQDATNKQPTLFDNTHVQSFKDELKEHAYNYKVRMDNLPDFTCLLYTSDAADE